MQDVARAAEGSQAPVSLVLNGVAGIRVSDQTRQRVIRAAEDLGYRRTPRLRADDREGSVIGLIIDDLNASPFASPLFEGAREAAWEHRCIVNIVTTRNLVAIEGAAIEAMLRQPVVGIIYATLITREVEPPALDAAVPMALLNCYDRNGDHAAVVPDDVAGARALTNSLLAAGHQRVGHIAGESWLDAGRDRLLGYREALEARGLAFDPALVQSYGSASQAGYDGTHALLDMADPPTAIFCFNDRMALGALGAIRERGLRVPEDVSIVGFDNDPFVTNVFPGGLTSAVLPHEDMARWAVEHILAVRRRARDDRQKRLMHCSIIRRKSVARPSRKA